MALLDNDKANVLFKHYFGAGSTRLSREFFEEAIKSSFIVKPDQLWKYSDMIPDGTDHSGGPEAIEKIKHLYGTEDETSIYTWFKSESEPNYPIVKKWTQLKLKAIDLGTDNSFQIVDPNTDEPIKNIIPFNYGSGDCEELYNYHLYLPDATMEIPFGVGDWVVDTYSGILTFYDRIPDGIDHTNPPLLTFFQYVGGNGFRQDVHGFEAVILPLDNIEFSDKACVTSEGIYKKIVDVCEKIEEGFTKTYGFDGYDKGEGVALSFEKIIPLLYGDTHDIVKGYEASADQVIRTLLSSKQASIPEIEFVSQQAVLGEVTIAFSEKEGQKIATVGEVETPIRAGMTDEDKWKVFLDAEKTSFVVVTPTEKTELTFNIIDGLTKDIPVITCVLLYWDTAAKDYLPFVTREPEKLYSCGVPVVAAQGKIPPSLMLDTDSLNSYQDVITPEYYGPRTVEWVIAHEGGREIKSADFIVKESKIGFSLEDAIAAGKVDSGKILLREGTYNINTGFTLSGNVIYEAESNVKLNGSVTLNPGIEKLLVINGLEIVDELVLTGEGTILLNNVKAPSLKVEGNVKVEVRNCTFGDISLDGNNEELLLLKDSTFNNILTKRDNLLIESCTFNSFVKEGEEAIKPIVLDSNIFQELNSKTSEIYTYGNYIGKWNVTGEQTPVPQNEDGILGTTGRLPIYNKGDTKHLLYTEISKPFNYFREGDERNPSWPTQNAVNVIELLYNPERVIIDSNGRLDVTLDTDDIVMPLGTEFPRGDNSWDYDPNKTLEPKKYGPDDKVTKVLKDLWHEKADLNDRGKVPLQQLPDEVSYGGMLYIGNWCFDEHTGLYPTKEDIERIFVIDPDPEKPSFQPGWFFIVEPPVQPDPEEEDVGDNPVKPQIAVDGVEFTAGDWLVVQTRDPEGLTDHGKGWVKIDRAYSDPIYSILSPHTERAGQPDTKWWWRDDGDKGGALPLGNKTLIQAIDDINMHLRKLEPKKPIHINELMLKCTNEKDLPTFDWVDFSTKLDYNSLDYQKIENIVYETFSKDDDRMISNYFYFGDEAEVSSKITNDEVFLPATKVTRESPEQIIDGTVISAATDPFLDADHGENFWKGLKITTTIPKEKMIEGENHLQVAVDKCMLVEGEDKTQHIGYAGAITTSYKLVDPYFNYTDKTFANIFLETTTYENLMKKGVCSGNFAMDMNEYEAFKLTFTAIGLYKDLRVPKNGLGRVWAECLGKNITEVVEIPYDTYTFFEDDKSSMNVKSLPLPISKDWNKDQVLRRDTDTIDFYVTVRDFYGNEYTKLLASLSSLEVDKCSETGRLTHGLFGKNSQIAEGDDALMVGFGNKWDSSFDLTRVNHNSLQRYGRMIGDRYVEEYRWPSGTAKMGEIGISYENYEGEEITDLGSFAGVCFSLGNVNEISGFTFEIEVEDDQKENFKYNSLTAETEDVLLECCVKPIGPLPTAWFDCNKANNGFAKPKAYKDPAMYAGHSSALIKRVTFGKQCLSGELFIRMAIKKDSGLQFKGIKLIEVI